MYEFILIAVSVTFVLLVLAIWRVVLEFRDLKEKELNAMVRLMQLEVKQHQLYQKVKKLDTRQSLTEKKQ